VDVLTPRPLGCTGLKVTPLCVGTGELGDMTSVYGYAAARRTARRPRGRPSWPARAGAAGGSRHGTGLRRARRATGGAAALQASLREPRITSTVVGMSRPERLEQTISLATHPVPDELWTVLADLTPAEENWLR
jgi:aryl-alcohol dehydrogenase-like predicted oxidoreductase